MITYLHDMNYMNCTCLLKVLSHQAMLQIWLSHELVMCWLLCTLSDMLLHDTRFDLIIYATIPIMFPFFQVCQPRSGCFTFAGCKNFSLLESNFIHCNEPTSKSPKRCKFISDADPSASTDLRCPTK